MKPVKNKYQKRAFTLSNIQVRQANGQPGQVTGIAAVFNKWSEDLGGFKEKIAPGAFAKTIQGGDIRALFNHNPDHILGRTKAGTLALKEVEAGLAVDIAMPDTSTANDLTVSMKRGDISQMSFGFQVIKDQWNSTGDERTLLEVKLFDVSPVTFPAYPQTSVQARSLSQARKDYNKTLIRDFRQRKPIYKELQRFKVGKLRLFS